MSLLSASSQMFGHFPFSKSSSGICEDKQREKLTQNNKSLMSAAGKLVSYSIPNTWSVTEASLNSEQPYSEHAEDNGPQCCLWSKKVAKCFRVQSTIKRCHGQASAEGKHQNEPKATATTLKARHA
ncbi:hypothetical protein F7725_018789 [Dissostichus mawsoni]|uniref:Uncharacterized protein n=1 Tax=Dissostichus mawsoni TaxID=36200 RepID=A0A7J5XSK8_DISMA|nr:hypothetical protein F7725_018789 [Dissostichus mawsoni]